MDLMFNLNYFISSFMFAIITITQIVTYPLFYMVGKDQFPIYHSNYVYRISLIAAPVMLVEILLAIVLVSISMSYLTISNFLVIFFIFLSTFFIQVPIHEKIKLEPNFELFNRLNKTNWIRTLLWFLKCIISFNILNEGLI